MSDKIKLTPTELKAKIAQLKADADSFKTKTQNCPSSALELTQGYNSNFTSNLEKLVRSLRLSSNPQMLADLSAYHKKAKLVAKSLESVDKVMAKKLGSS